MAIFENGLLRDIFQNNIDYVSKQIQTFNDFLFGVSDDEDGSANSAVQPFQFQGTCGVSCSYAFIVNPSNFGNNGYTGNACFGVMDVNIYDNTVLWTQPTFIGFNSNAVQWYTGYQNEAKENFNQLYSHFNYQLLEQYADWHIVCSGGTANNLYAVDGKGNYSNSCWNNQFNPQYYGWNYASYYSKNQLSLYGGGFANLNSNGSYSSNYPSISELDFCFCKDAPVITNTNNNNIVNQIRNNNTVNNYNTYTYVTNQGDTITYNVGDYFIYTPTQDIPLSYDDWFNMMQVAIDDINLRFNFDKPLIVPTYDDLKYTDVGDFYIQKLHQYDKLPAAPAFDGSIEFGDIPKVIGESANSYLGLLGATASALLSGCFITALIVKKLGR